MLSPTTLSKNRRRFETGAPGRTRTYDQLVRSQPLYPTELRARIDLKSYKKVYKWVVRFPLDFLKVVAHRRKRYPYHNKKCCYDYRKERRVHSYQYTDDYENYTYYHSYLLIAFSITPPPKTVSLS